MTAGMLLFGKREYAITCATTLQRRCLGQSISPERNISMPYGAITTANAAFILRRQYDDSISRACGLILLTRTSDSLSRNESLDSVCS